MTDKNSLAEFVNGLRDLANFLEAHPELGVPSADRYDYFGLEKKDLKKYARAFGVCDKDAFSNYFILRKSFGPIRLEANWHREQVCKPVVTGTKEVEEKVAVAYETRMVTKDIVEWQCPKSILKTA